MIVFGLIAIGWIAGCAVLLGLCKAATNGDRRPR